MRGSSPGARPVVDVFGSTMVLVAGGRLHPHDSPWPCLLHPPLHSAFQEAFTSVILVVNVYVACYVWAARIFPKPPNEIPSVSSTGKAQQYEGLMIKQVTNSCGHFGKKALQPSEL